MQGRKINALCEVNDCKRPAMSTKPIKCCVVHKARWQRNKTFELKNWYIPGITEHGYIRINVDGRRVLEHKYIMEQYLGRKLKFPQEIVHHKNDIKTDNRIENLEILSQSKHMAHHLPAKKLYLNDERRKEIMDIGNSFTGKRIRTKVTCKVKGCTKPTTGRFLCKTHYSRYWFYSTH